MADWSGGYVTDIEYMRAFHREQAPSHLDLVCLLKGVAPPEPPEKMTHCDLGCGPGFTSALLAAANPEADFWGIDFNPAHIAAGRAFQAEMGLPNLHLCEYGFGDLAEGKAPEVPLFDYVTLHGVFSWIGPSERQAIVRFLEAHLKPGGVVYVGYNSLPMWTSRLPFQRILSTYGRFSRERSDRAAEQGIAFIKRLAEAGAFELNRPEILTRFDELLAAGQQRYLAHEYLVEQWTPMYHEDVAREFTTAKLDYVGSATLLENFVQLYLTPAQRELCEQLGGPAVFETVKDFFLKRSFRGDVYVRGRRRLSPGDQTARLRRIVLDLLVPLNELRFEFSVPVGKSQLNEALYRPVLEALGRGAASVGDLLDMPQAAGTKATAVELIGMLLGTGQAIWRIREADGATRRHALAFNAAVAARAVEEGDAFAALVAPTAGSGIYLGQAETMTYVQLASGVEASTDAISARITDDLARLGIKLRAEGKELESREETLAAVRHEVAPTLANWLPRWRQLGVI